MNVTLDNIRRFFQTQQPESLDAGELIRAGVLIALTEKKSGLHVILTQRTDEVEHHKGQISFPGGSRDESDVTIIDTSLREAEEEIGLARNSVEVLGVLNDFRTPSGFCITPVVGFVRTIPDFILNKKEVLDLFEVPLSFFLDPDNEKTEMREYNGKIRAVYHYFYGKHEIWGITAAILRAFLLALKGQFDV